MFTTKKTHLYIIILFIVSLLLVSCGNKGTVAIDPTKAAESLTCTLNHTENCEVWSESKIASCIINAQGDKDTIALCKAHKATK